MKYRDKEIQKIANSDLDGLRLWAACAWLALREPVKISRIEHIALWLVVLHTVVSFWARMP